MDKRRRSLGAGDVVHASHMHGNVTWQRELALRIIGSQRRSCTPEALSKDSIEDRAIEVAAGRGDGSQVLRWQQCEDLQAPSSQTLPSKHVNWAITQMALRNIPKSAALLRVPAASPITLANSIRK